MRLAPLLFFLWLPLGAACHSTEGPAFERRASVPHLAAGNLTLRLVDARAAVDDEAVSVSAFTMPNQDQELALPLDPALEATLRETLAQELVPAARSLHLEVTVREARAGWSAGWLSETEEAHAKLDVTAHDEHGNLLASGATDSWARRSSWDTSQTAVRRAFDNVLRDALFRFLAGPECAALRTAPDAAGAPR